MKIHIIATPRSGGTGFASDIAKHLGLPFINEPFKFGQHASIANVFKTNFGGGIEENLGGYVAHHIPSQYLTHYGTQIDRSNEFELYIVERKDTWDQFLSFVTTLALQQKYGFHNIRFQEEEIEINKFLMQRFFEELLFAGMLKRTTEKYQQIYYEDINFSGDSFVKNQGRDLIKIKNLSVLEDQYNYFIERQSKQ